MWANQRKKLEWVWANLDRLMSNAHFVYAACTVVALIIGVPFLLWDRGLNSELFVAIALFSGLAYTFFDIGCRTVARQMQNDANSSTIEGGNDQ